MISLLPQELQDMRIKRNAKNRLLLVCKWRNDDPKIDLVIRYLRNKRTLNKDEKNDAKRVIWAFLSMDEINAIRAGAPVRKQDFAQVEETH